MKELDAPVIKSFSDSLTWERISKNGNIIDENLRKLTVMCSSVENPQKWSKKPYKKDTIKLEHPLDSTFTNDN